MPALYIITGSNGAGKSTIGYNYLPTQLQKNIEVFDGDKLFMQHQRTLWKAGITAHKEAKKIAFTHVEDTFNSLVNTAINHNTDFAYEGHFTNQATWEIPRRFKSNGYTIHLIFFGLKDVALSELRVIDRTREGGHYVDPLTLSSNYFGNLEKLHQHYEMFDSVQIADTSEAAHKVLCLFVNGNVESAINSILLPQWFTTNLFLLAEKIRKKETL